MALCLCGVAPGIAYVFITPGVHRSARPPLSNARSFRMPSLGFPMASVSGMRLRLRGEPAFSLSPFSAPLRRERICGLSFGGPLIPRGVHKSDGSFASPLIRRGVYKDRSSTSPMIQRGVHKLDRSLVVSRASKGASISVDSEKPMWWWRTAACLPYFLPFHETWNYGETAYFLQPYLERFEFLTNPVLEVPSWFSMFYFFVAYLWLVRRKELPHFVRFHIMMGMLLENALQIIWTVSRWMPLTVFGVKVGVYFWTAVSFAFFLCILECMRCALAGKYVDLPYISDAAYMQIPRS